MAIPVVQPRVEPTTRRHTRGRMLATRRQRRDLLWAILFIAPQLFGMIVFSLFPVISAFVLSVMKWDGLGDREFVGLANFRDQFTDPDFQEAMINTLIYTLIAVPGTVILSLALALAVNRVRGKTIYRTIFFLPTITSSVAVSMVWLWLLNGDFGLINVFLRETFDLNPPNWLVNSTWVVPAVAMVAVWAGLGFNMVIFLAGLQGIPATYLEAAQIDGASKWQQFWNITLPLLSPTTFFVTIISIIASFQVFDMIYVMTGGGPGNESTTMVFHIYELAFVNFTFGVSSAAAVILFGLIMAVTLFQFWGQRRWVHYDV
ncbi:MAG TPA: sugar ABC transporter permease [Thermomicrobiales bacterium]|nr:sugar ABC transporter permease [Thermomicrobiales bacterium]